MKKIFILLMAAVLFCLPTVVTSEDDVTPSAPPTTLVIEKSEIAHALYVVDGDTFEIKFSDGRKAGANLMAVDAPGRYEPECTHEFTDEATKVLEDMISGKDITITWDSIDKTTKNGRKYLVYVSVDGFDVGKTMIAKGLAIVPEKFPADRKERYKKIENEARKKGIGIWNKCKPSDFDKR